jgi:hypothetical protein
VPLPGLESAYIHPMSQVLGGKRVAEFMQKEVMAIRSVRAFVAMLGKALPTIQLRPMSDSLHDFIVIGVGIPTFIGKHQLRRQRVPSLFQSAQLVFMRSCC